VNSDADSDARARLARKLALAVGARASATGVVNARTGSEGGQSTRRGRRRLALGWDPPEQLDRAGWLAAGSNLAEFGRVNNWWVGDWIRYGNACWGEKYVEVARITGLDVKTLRNVAYVASRFDASRRRDELTWTHHAEVAALEPALQEEWLERALAQRLSPGDLRIELRAAQRALAPSSHSPEERPRSLAQTVSCPYCGGAFALADLRLSSTAMPSAPDTSG
jgi:hypothetical protein